MAKKTFDYSERTSITTDEIITEIGKWSNDLSYDPDKFEVTIINLAGNSRTFTLKGKRFYRWSCNLIEQRGNFWCIKR